MPFGLTGHRIVAACALVAALAACSARPFVVGAPKALTRALEREAADAEETAAPRPRIVSICYGRPFNSPEEVLEEARLACPDGEVTFQDTDSFWTPCGLLQPVRASFLCQPAPSAE